MQKSEVNGHRDRQLYFTFSISTVLCSVPCPDQNEKYLMLDSSSPSDRGFCFSLQEFRVPGFIMAL